jgi:hypothetical protein
MIAHHQINTRHCIPAHGGATVHLGARHTTKQAGDLSDNEVFSRPEFENADLRCIHGFGAGSAYPQGRQHNLFCVSIPSPTLRPRQPDGGFQFNKERETMTTTPASLRTAYALSQAHHALARHVPDMAHGFTIQTGYGQINIPPGPTAKRITALVEKMLRAELADAAKTAQTAQTGGAE